MYFAINDAGGCCTPSVPNTLALHRVTHGFSYVVCIRMVYFLLEAALIYNHSLTIFWGYF